MIIWCAWDPWHIQLYDMFLIWVCGDVIIGWGAYYFQHQIKDGKTFLSCHHLYVVQTFIEDPSNHPKLSIKIVITCKCLDDQARGNEQKQHLLCHPRTRFPGQRKIFSQKKKLFTLFRSPETIPRKFAFPKVVE